MTCRHRDGGQHRRMRHLLLSFYVCPPKPALRRLRVISISVDLANQTNSHHIEWNSLDELNASEAKTTVERKMSSHLSDAPYDYKMVTTPGFDDVFSAPVIEVITWFYPLPMVTPEFEALLPENFQKFAAGLKAAPEHRGGASAGWGLDEVDRNGQRCKTFTGFIGWESAAAHSAARKTPPFLDHIHYLRHPGNAGVTVWHFSFTTSL
jgi:hypothetical protein